MVKSSQSFWIQGDRVLMELTEFLGFVTGMSLIALLIFAVWVLWKVGKWSLRDPGDGG